MASIFAAFRSTKSRDKWVTDASQDQILLDLTETFLKGNDHGFAPALTAEETAAFEKNFKTMAGSSNVISQERLINFLASSAPTHATTLNASGSELYRLVSFFSAFPFSSSGTLYPLTSDALLRSIVALTGRGEKLIGAKSESFSKEAGTQITQRGRDESDRRELLFRSLAEKAPAASFILEDKDLLDVLAAIQPHPNPTTPYLPRDDLKPMAQRLSIKPALIEDLRVPAARLNTFMRLVTPDFNTEGTELDYAAFEKALGAEQANVGKHLFLIMSAFIKA